MRIMVAVRYISFVERQLFEIIQANSKSIEESIRVAENRLARASTVLLITNIWYDILIFDNKYLVRYFNL
jgi:hypothetical protein